MLEENFEVDFTENIEENSSIGSVNLQKNNSKCTEIKYLTKAESMEYKSFTFWRNLIGTVDDVENRINAIKYHNCRD